MLVSFVRPTSMHDPGIGEAGYRRGEYAELFGVDEEYRQRPSYRVGDRRDGEEA